MKWRTVVLAGVVGAIMMAILPAQADHVDAIRVNGNSTCTSVGSTGDFSFKIAPVVPGEYTDPGPGGATIDIFLNEKNPQPNTFSFSIEGGAVHDAIVKGSAANHYDYAANGGPVTFDFDLTIPNGNSLKHAIFCYDIVLDPEIAGTKFNDANASGTNDGDAGIPGWDIFLLEDTGDGFNFIDSTVTDSNGNYSFPAPVPNENYVVCEADQGPTGDGWFQTAPLEQPENDVCPDTVPGEEFGAAIAPGGYAVSYAEGDSVTGLDFFNFDGDPEAEGQPLPCGGTATTSEGGTSGSFTRESTGDCDEEKNAVLDIEGETIVFIPRGLGSANYTGELSFIKQHDDEFLLRLQYDPDDNGQFRDVPACEDVTFSESGVTATIPAGNGDTWCFYDVDAQPASEAEPGDWQVNWSVFGISDPRFK